MSKFCVICAGGSALSIGIASKLDNAVILSSRSSFVAAVNQFTNQLTNQPVNQLTNQSVNQLTNQSMNQLTNQLTNQFTNQLTNQKSIVNHISHPSVRAFSIPLVLSDTKIHMNESVSNLEEYLKKENLDFLVFLMLTKCAIPTEWMAKYCEKLMKKKKSIMISLQNGWGYESLIEKTVKRSVIVGRTTMGAYQVEEGIVKVSGLGETVFVDPSEPVEQEMLSQFVQLFGNVFPCKIVSGEYKNQVIFGKLVVNVCINLLASLLHVENGELLCRPCFLIMLGVVKEISLFFEMERISLGPDYMTSPLNIHEKWSSVLAPYLSNFAAIKLRDSKHLVSIFQLSRSVSENISPIESVMLDRVLTVCLNTRSNVNSMLADLQRKRPTEVEFIAGNLLKRGKQISCNMPLIQSLYNGIQSIESH